MRRRTRYWMVAWVFMVAAWVFAAIANGQEVRLFETNPRHSLEVTGAGIVVPDGVVYGAPGITIPGVTVAEAEQVTIIGPATAKPNTEVVCRLQGTPSIDLTRPLADQLAWLIGTHRMRVCLAAPGKPMAPLDVRAEIVFGHDGATMQPMIRVAVEGAGEYRLLVDWNFDPMGLVEHVITVEGGVEPAPPNPPDPPAPEPDPPNPIEPVQIMIFHESDDLDNMSLAQLSMTSGRVFRREFEERGHKFHGAHDRNAVAPSGCIGGVCPTKRGSLNPWYAAAKGQDLPCVVIAPRAGGDMKAYPLPADAEALYALIGGAE